MSQSHPASKGRICPHGMTLETGCMHCPRVIAWAHEIARECNDPEHTEAMRHLAAIADTEAERDRLREVLVALSKQRPDDDIAALLRRIAASPDETGEKRAYYETHDPPHCPTCGCGLPRADACSCGRVELKDGYVRATCADGSVHTKAGCNSPSKADEHQKQCIRNQAGGDVASPGNQSSGPWDAAEYTGQPDRDHE